MPVSPTESSDQGTIDKTFLLFLMKLVSVHDRWAPAVIVPNEVELHNLFRREDTVGCYVWTRRMAR